MKKVLALVLSMSILLGLAGCGAKDTADDLAYLQEKGKMVIGITEYAPMDYRNEAGEWIGFDADLANKVGDALGVEVEFLVLADWGQKYYELDTKNIDCIWNGLTINEEATLNASVTDPYALNAQVVVLPADKAGKYTTPESLSGLTFAVESGSAGEGVLQDMGIADLVAVQDQPAAIMEVAAGTSDACVIDITMARAMTGAGTSYENLAIAQNLTEEQYGIAFRKGSNVTAKVNELLAGYKADGTLAALSETYGVAVLE